MRGKNKMSLENIAINILSKEKTITPIVSAPGTFSEIVIHETEDSPWDEINDDWHLKAEPSYSQNLIEQYKFFNQGIYSPKRVFYPCSELDASPVQGFPDAEVVIMDKDERTSGVMKRHKVPGYIQEDVLTYIPKKPFDLVIILNPQQNSKDLTKHLVKGGFVLANNWHDNASELSENPNYQEIGTIDRDEKGYFLAGNLKKLEPNQFETYFYVFRNRGVEEA